MKCTARRWGKQWLRYIDQVLSQASAEILYEGCLTVVVFQEEEVLHADPVTGRKGALHYQPHPPFNIHLLQEKREVTDRKLWDHSKVRGKPNHCFKSYQNGFLFSQTDLLLLSLTSRGRTNPTFNPISNNSLKIEQIMTRNFQTTTLKKRPWYWLGLSTCTKKCKKTGSTWCVRMKLWKHLRNLKHKQTGETLLVKSEISVTRRVYSAHTFVTPDDPVVMTNTYKEQPSVSRRAICTHARYK